MRLCVRVRAYILCMHVCMCDMCAISACVPACVCVCVCVYDCVCVVCM